MVWRAGVRIAVRWLSQALKSLVLCVVGCGEEGGKRRDWSILYIHRNKNRNRNKELAVWTGRGF